MFFSVLKNVASLLLIVFALHQTAFANEDCRPSFEISFFGTFNNTVCDVSGFNAPANFNGQITVVPTGAESIADFSYEWYQGASSNSANLLFNSSNVLSQIAGGTYSVTITDNQSGCESFLIATIFNDTSVPVIPNLAVIPADVTTCGGGISYPNGQIVIDETSIVGSGPFSYEYYSGNSVLADSLIVDGLSIFDHKLVASPAFSVLVSGSNTSSITGLNEGLYTVVAVSEITGCRSDPVTINLSENTGRLPLAISAVINETFSNTVCDISVAGGPSLFNGQITVVPTDGSDLSDYAFEWYQGSGILTTNRIASGNSNVLDNLAGGTYTVLATNLLTGCQMTLEHTIFDETTTPEFANVSASFTSVDVSLCAHATGYPNGGIFIDLTEIVGFTSKDDYAIRYYFGTSAVPTSLLLVDNTLDIFSQKGLADASVNSNVIETAIGQLTGLNAGKYTVTVVDLRTGCESLPFTVEVNDYSAFLIPDFTPVTTNNTVCDFTVSADYNGSISLSAISRSVTDYSYNWYAGQTTDISASIPANAVSTAEVNTTGNVITEIPGGVYTVVITNLTTQCSSQLEFTVTDDLTDIPLVNGTGLIVSDVTICEGNIDFPNGAITVATVSGGSGSYAFEWYAGTSVNSAKLLSAGDNIFTVTGKPGNIGANGSVSFTNGGASINGLSAGTYTLRVVDTQTGCTSSIEQFDVLADQPIVSGTITKNADDFSCDATNPSGQLTATATSSGIYAFEWYRGTSAAGTILGTNAVLSGVSTGNYTVKIINEATGCFVTLSESVDRIVPAVLITTDGPTTLQTSCTPANASVSVQLSSPLFSGPTPVGFLQNLTYEWYRGQTIDPANLIPSETSETLSGVTSGFYTVIATESSSGCQSLPFTVQLSDNLSATMPAISSSFGIIPNDCAATNGEITGTINLVDNPTGSDFSFQWFEGSQNYADDTTLGIALTTGSTLSDGLTVVTVNTPNTVSGAGSATLSGIVPRLYTLVAENLTTGCRTQEVFDLSYLNIQQTSGTTTAHVEECPDTGVISVGLEDDPANAGYVAGDVDDITEYQIFLYAGNGVPADRFTAYTFEGTAFPLIFDPATGNLTDGNGTLVSLGTPLSTGENATFTGLPAGIYTAIAREVLNPAFNPVSTNQCWSLSSIHEVEKRNFEPLISLTQTIANTVCDFATFGGNGRINIAIKKDQNDENPPSPDGFKCTLYDGTSNTDAVITTESFTTASASFIVNSLDPQDYLVEIERIKGAVSTGCITSVIVNIQNESEVHEIFSADVTNQTNCSPNNASITINDDDISINGDASSGDVADYTFSWYEESLSNPIGGETGNSLSLSTFQAGVYLVTATNSASGCTTSPFKIDIENLTVAPEVLLNINTVDSSCDPDANEGNGEISFAIENPAVNTDYDFQWYVGTTTALALSGSGVVDGASGTLNGSLEADYTATLSGIDGNQQYTLEVIDRSDPNNACSIVATIFLPETITEKSLRPSLDVSIEDNENCVNPNGSIVISGVFEGGLQQSVANYSFQWFDADGTDITSSALDNGSGVDNELTDLEAGTYEVLITNNLTQCANDQRIALTVEEVVEHPDIQLIARRNNTLCFALSGGTGSLEIAIREGGTELTTISAADYTINWYEGSSTSSPELTTATIGGSYSNVVSGLATGNYTVEVIKGSSSSPNAGCSSVATFTIGSDLPVLSIDRGIDVFKTDDFNCSQSTGAIEIAAIRENGFAIAVNATNYTFRWFDSNGNDITSIAVAGITTVGHRNRIENLEAGTYSVIATNTFSSCSTDSFEFIIDDLSENPIVQIALLNSDTFCDNTGNEGDGQLEIQITHNGLLADLADYTVTWYRGGTTATALTSALGSASIGGTNNNSLTGLSAGQYTVEVTSDMSPNLGCSGVATFTVASELPIISLHPQIDLTIGDNQNCFDPDGFIEINTVREDGISITVSVTNYNFQWFDGTGADITARAVNSTGTGNRIEDLEAGEYGVIVTDTETGCASGMITLLVEDAIEVADIQLDVTTADQYCDNFGNAGNGTLEISISDSSGPVNLSDYTVEWYRGNGTSNQIFPVDGGTRGTATLLNTTSIAGLSSGEYTVVVTKSTLISPGAGCQVMGTFTVDSDVLDVTLSQSTGVVKQANTNATATPNGFIEIVAVSEGGVEVAVSSSNYSFNWFDESGNEITSSAVTGNTVAGTQNRLEELDNGFYIVEITNTVTGCISDEITIYLADPFVWSGAVDIDWNEAGNWVGGVVPPATADALIPDEETIDNNPTIYREITINNLIIEAGGSLAVTGDYLLINGSLLNDGEIFISGEQSLVLMGTRLGTGRSQAFQQLRGSLAWQIIGLPITGGSYSTSNSLFFTYDNDQQEFVRKFGAPAPGEGMFMAVEQEDLTGNGVDFNTGRGILNFGEISRDITLNADGFNLIANPYAASIDAQAFFANPDNMMYTTGTAYLWNDADVNVGNLRGGDYITVNSVGAVGGPIDPGNGTPGSKSTADFDGSFNSFQGFFIEATDDGHVTFMPSMQETANNLNDNFFRQTGQSGKMLRLSLSNRKLYNDLIITLDENATLSDDYSMDARKFAGNNQLSFYSRHQEANYAILALPANYSADQDVVLEMQIGKEGDYLFTVEEILNFDENEIVILTDQLTGVEYDLTTAKELTLNLKEGLVEDRFTVSFRNNQITAINESKLAGLKVYGDTESITLHYPGINEQVTIFDLNGRKLFDSTVGFWGGTAVIAPALSAGKVYVIRVNDEVLKFRLK